MILAALLLAQTLVISSEQKLLTGPLHDCAGVVNPKLGTYTITLWCRAEEQRWQWTFTEEGGPFYGHTIVNGCRSHGFNGCRQPFTISRIAPVSSINYVPDAWAAAFTAYQCYHVFFVQRGDKVDWCYPSGYPREGP